MPLVDQSLYAKALDLGYIGELYTAIYLLAPKIENLFRIYLNNEGVPVLKTDKEGNETYVVLDKLLDKAQNKAILIINLLMF